MPSSSLLMCVGPSGGINIRKRKKGEGKRDERRRKRDERGRKELYTGFDKDAAATKGDSSPTSDKYFTKMIDPNENLKNRR